MKLMKTEDAIGQVLCHDITQIIPGVTKDAVFRKGHIITEEDIPVLLSVGKEHIYIWEKDEHMLHENEAAQILYEMCKNDHIHPSEVKEGKIELIADQGGLLKVDREKLKEYDCEMIFHEVYDDDHEVITKGCLQAIEQGAELVLCTGGMSVDPDDRTPLAIKNACTEVVTYGAPVLPGAMFMLAYCEKEGRQIPVMGLPGCVMYAKRTIFDLVLPRIMCDEKLHEKDFRLLGQGGLCLSCPVCTFPNCGFGKGGY